MASEVNDYPILPIEYPLSESLLIYGKRLVILLGVMLANLVLFGLLVIAYYQPILFSTVIVLGFFVWIRGRIKAMEETQAQAKKEILENQAQIMALIQAQADEAKARRLIAEYKAQAREIEARAESIKEKARMKSRAEDYEKIIKILRAQDETDGTIMEILKYLASSSTLEDQSVTQTIELLTQELVQAGSFDRAEALVSLVGAEAALASLVGAEAALASLVGASSIHESRSEYYVSVLEEALQDRKWMESLAQAMLKRMIHPE